MGLEIKTIPYELLIRWTPDGELSGASFIPRINKLLDGEIINSDIANPIPLRRPDGTINSGLSDNMIASLRDVLGDVTLSALTDANTFREKFEKATTDLSETNDTLKDIRSQLNTTIERNENLKTHVKDADHKIKKLQETNDRNSVEINRQQNQINVEQMDAAKLEQELTESKARVEQLEIEKQSAENDLIRLLKKETLK